MSHKICFRQTERFSEFCIFFITNRSLSRFLILFKKLTAFCKFRNRQKDVSSIQKTREELSFVRWTIPLIVLVHKLRLTAMICQQLVNSNFHKSHHSKKLCSSCRSTVSQTNQLSLDPPLLGIKLPPLFYTAKQESLCRCVRFTRPFSGSPNSCEARKT